MNPMDPAQNRTPSARTTATARSSAANDALTHALTRTLSQAPDIQIAPDFAGRVARAAVAQPMPRTQQWLGWGPRLALGSGALLTLALFCLAPHTVPNLSSLRFDAELVLFAELGALVLCTPRLLSRD